jgi:preprotein translocase subunit SecD
MKAISQTRRNRLLISLCCIVTAAGGLAHSRGETSPTISFRLAFEEEASDTTKMQFQAPNEVVYVSKSSVLGEKDLLKATVEHSPSGPLLIVTVTPDGAKRLKQATSSHLGARLAVVVNGILISAPTIRQVIEGNELSVSSSRLAESQIEDLAKMVNNTVKR